MNRNHDHPIDILWQASTLLSIFAASELFAVSLALAGDDGGSVIIRFGLLSFATFWVALLTLGLLYALRVPLRQVGGQSLIGFALLAMTFVCMASIYLGWQLFGVLWHVDERGWWLEGLRYSGSLLCMTAFGLLSLRSLWTSRQLALRAKESELQALQARIRPHFLFNTLNTGAALVHERPEEAERLLLDLADLFRAALGGPRQIPLAYELSLARRYLEIEALRFGERLTVHWDLPRELPAVTVPALSIQPLVENAVRHGVERLASGDVDVRVTTTAERVIVRISNPIPPAGGETSTGHRVGLNASKARIEAMTDGRGSVLTEVEDGRFIATVRLPLGK